MIVRAADKFQAELDSPRSQTSLAYETIRSDILYGRLIPEKKLKIQELAVRVGVSPGAVREALSRLVPEQLVVSRDQRGFIVAPLSLADLHDLTELRCEIEAIALRRAVKAGDVNWEANILAAEHRLSGPLTHLGADEAKRVWTQNHTDFHTALISACGSRRLLGLHAQLYEQSERYRGLLTFHGDEANSEANRDVNKEHRMIVEYALARDADKLVATMINHLRLTTALIVETFGPASACNVTE